MEMPMEIQLIVQVETTNGDTHGDLHLIRHGLTGAHAPRGLTEEVQGSDPLGELTRATAGAVADTL